ncbi:MAG: imidazoleglycerol-phosphate dehydratase HisB [Clostridiales bacterium]|nr:imidazoleglycerol-phosphate dehydratase HisB [Clostridiales bacterium]
MRNAKINRKTNETDITISLEIDGKGKYDIDTKVGFLDHMLTLFSRHSLIDLDVKCDGDIEIDCHHSVEDVGIALGQAISKALGNKESIKRFGTFFVPMDETLVMVSLDISNRPYLYYDLDLPAFSIGNFDTEMVEEFFRAIAQNAGLTLHIKILHGKNTHHIIEAAFKAFGRAVNIACTIDKRFEGVPSTKGML